MSDVSGLTIEMVEMDLDSLHQVSVSASTPAQLHVLHEGWSELLVEEPYIGEEVAVEGQTVSFEIVGYPSIYLHPSVLVDHTPATDLVEISPERLDQGLKPVRVENYHVVVETY